MSSDWKQINDPDLASYEISKDGKIKDKNGYIYEPSSMYVGYRVFNLKNDKNKWVLRYQHRLLGQTYLDNPENKPCIDHIDGNRGNNSIDNLRWATRSENSANCKLRKDNKTGFRGITKFGNKFKCVCSKEYLGLFATPEEAYQAYCEKKKTIYGAYAKV